MNIAYSGALRTINTSESSHHRPRVGGGMTGALRTINTSESSHHRPRVGGGMTRALRTINTSESSHHRPRVGGRMTGALPSRPRIPSVESQTSRPAAALVRPKRTAAGFERLITQGARPNAAVWRPRHNAGVVVAAGLGRSAVVVADQLWSPWDQPRRNQRECRIQLPG